VQQRGLPGGLCIVNLAAAAPLTTRWRPVGGRRRPRRTPPTVDGYPAILRSSEVDFCSRFVSDLSSRFFMASKRSRSLLAEKGRKLRPDAAVSIKRAWTSKAGDVTETESQMGSSNESTRS
jgi:hypothetical protein